MRRQISSLWGKFRADTRKSFSECIEQTNDSKWNLQWINSKLRVVHSSRRVLPQTGVFYMRKWRSIYGGGRSGLRSNDRLSTDSYGGALNFPTRANPNAPSSRSTLSQQSISGFIYSQARTSDVMLTKADKVFLVFVPEIGLTTQRSKGDEGQQLK